jgi:transposase InsO family protein
MTSKTIISHLLNLFSVFGLAGYVHSDNGPSLVSDELRSFLLNLGIAHSNSSVYNPRGNGQVERFNGMIWKSIELAY